MYLMLFTETLPSLPYSLWALPDWSGWLDWLAWLVRLWVTRKNRSLSPKKSRSTIRVSVGLPPAAHEGRWAHAHHSMVHCELCLWLSRSLAHSRESNWSYAWLGSIMDNISVYYTHTSACTKVGSDAHQAHKEVRERRGFLGLLCSPSCPPIDQIVRADDEAGPEPSLSFRAASEAERRSRSVRLRLGPTHAAALVNATALRGA